MPALLDHQLLFVTGKGGVGKTSIAAALAVLAADRGKRVLLGEVDAKGDLADVLECGPTSFKAKEASPGLRVMSMDTEESLKEYLSLQLKLPLMAKIGPLARVFEFVATAAPGVREVLTVGKFLWEVQSGNHDLVIVDASATGHIVGQLSAPQAINELVQMGAIRQQTGWMTEVLGDHQRTGVVIVTTPEEMPVRETIDLAGRLDSQTNTYLAAVVVNRVLPELFTREEEALFEDLARRTDEVSEATGGEVGPVFAAARLAVTLRRTRAGHLDDLRRDLDPAVPLLYLPYLFARIHGLRATRMLAEALGEELGF